MKKIVMESVVAILTNQKSELTAEQVVAAMQEELNKSMSRKAEVAAARQELYDTIAPIIRSVMAEPMTAMEIFEATKDDLPEGFTARKVQYFLVNDMKNEVTVDNSGKKNKYALK